MNSEIEVTITIDNNDKTATVYASKGATLLGKLKRAAAEYPAAVQLLSADRYGARFSVQVDYLLKSSIRPPRRVELTDERRNELKARMHEVRAATRINFKVEPSRE
ncbi:MAG: hypothetical protein II920_07505 [Clostridia bacterium]|nr:hypothetical protein [Clostridia bacterium]